MTDRHTLADVEPLLAAELPGFMRWAMGAKLWDENNDPEFIGSALLGDLRLWLLEQPRWRHSDRVAHAFDVIERLAHTDDPRLKNALCVELLEGWWPRRQRRLMGPRTRELWEPAYRNPVKLGGRPLIGINHPR